MAELREEIGDELTLRQEVFCRLYTQNNELFGNATLSYAEAYDYNLDELSREAEYETNEDENGAITTKKVADSAYDKAYNVCGVSAHHLLKNPKIDRRIIDLLNEFMNDKQIDAEIIKVIKQNRDMSAKMRAIAEYNKLRQRIIEKNEISGNIETNLNLSDEQFNRIIRTRAEKINSDSSGS